MKWEFQLFKSVLKKIAHCVLGEYAFYRIYYLDLEKNISNPVTDKKYSFECINEPKLLLSAKDGAIQKLTGYDGNEAIGYMICNEGIPVCACWYWYGQRYHQRRFWPLQNKQAKLVQIVTDANFRGQGLAGQLICLSSVAMKQKGFESLFARIWHSNSPSLSAFEKSGWLYIAWVIEIFPFRKKHPFRIERRL